MITLNKKIKPSMTTDDKYSFPVDQDYLGELKTFYEKGDYQRVSDEAESPWLLFDGKLIGTGQDHLSYAADYGFDSYGEFSRETGALRISYFTNEKGKFSLTVQVYEGQPVSEKQIEAIKNLLGIAKNSELAVGFSKSDGMHDIENPIYEFMTINNLVDKIIPINFI